MQDAAEIKPHNEGTPWGYLGAILCANVFADLAAHWTSIPHLPVYMLALTVTFGMINWWNAKSPSNPLKEIGRLLLWSGYLALGFWLAPKVLSKWLWLPLATALPVFIVCLSVFVILSLPFGKKARPGFKETSIVLLICVGFSLLSALMVTDFWRSLKGSI